MFAFEPFVVHYAETFIIPASVGEYTIKPYGKSCNKECVTIQKKDTLILNLETLDLAMIRGLLQAFNGRVTAGAGTKPYLSVVLQPDEKPLELLQNILKAMADILTGTRKRD